MSRERAAAARRSPVARLARALERDCGHVVVAGSDTRAAKALTELVVPNIDAYRSVRFSARDVRTDQVIDALIADDGSGDRPAREARRHARHHDGLRALYDDAHVAGKSVLVIVEDADVVSPHGLEQLRAALERGPDALGVVRIVLVGGKRLLHNLKRPEARALASRIIAYVPVPSVDADAQQSAGMAARGRPMHYRLATAGLILLVIAWLTMRRDTLVQDAGQTNVAAVAAPLRAAPQAQPHPQPNAPVTVAPALDPQLHRPVDVAAALDHQSRPPVNVAPALQPTPHRPARLPAADHRPHRAVAPEPSPVRRPDSTQSSAATAASAPVAPPVAIASTAIDGSGPERNASARTAAATRASVGPTYTLQVASFTGPMRAARLRDALTAAFDDVYLTLFEHDGVVYHRVRVGRFASIAAVESTELSLRSHGYAPLRMQTKAN